jgi:hypothetical protein
MTPVGHWCWASNQFPGDKRLGDEFKLSFFEQAETSNQVISTGIE